MRVRRLLDGPIVPPNLHPSIGANVQGPSLIRVPEWITNALGRYYLYFADHKGSHIRLAYANALIGPWTIHVPGSLQLGQSGFLTAPPAVSPAKLAEMSARQWGISHDVLTEITTPHIASPDVHVDDANRRIVMYFHGLEAVGHQVSRVALSADGINFQAQPEVLGQTYMRVFTHRGTTYALAMPGQIYRGRDALSGFVAGPLLFNRNMRHAALLLRGDTLFVFWTQVGDVPESILCSQIDLSGDWMRWRDGPAEFVMKPERKWEGAEAPLLPSVRSTAYGIVNQLRDPAIYEEASRTFLLYACAGEAGIGLSELSDPPNG